MVRPSRTLTPWSAIVASAGYSCRQLLDPMNADDFRDIAGLEMLAW